MTADLICSRASNNITTITNNNNASTKATATAIAHQASTVAVALMMPARNTGDCVSNWRKDDGKMFNAKKQNAGGGGHSAKGHEP